MTLRARLLIALFALALLPTFVLGWFALTELGSSTERWHLPAVERALDASVEVSRTALARVEATVLTRADDWAAELDDAPLAAASRARLREGLRSAGLDFVQVYQRQAGRWRRADQVFPAAVLTADSLDLAAELDAAIAGERLVRSKSGILAAVASAGPDRALVTGIRLTPDYFSRVEEIGHARTLYARLAVLVEVQRRYVWLLVGTLIAAIAIAAFVIASSLASQMTRPLGSLLDAFGRVASGSLDTRIAPSGASELQALARSFNTMTEKLAEARRALSQAEREAAWRDVARQLAHEIKNPLTPMRLSLHRLEKRIATVPEAERKAVTDSVQALLQEVEHLTRLADQFSHFAKLPEAIMESLDLAEVASSAAALHEPDGLMLVVACDVAVPVIGDRLLLSRALHNLILNACEASPRGSKLTIQAGVEGAEGWIEVLDQGAGVPAALAERVFEPYVSTKNRGSGLGLSLVRDIANRHGGRITLENRTEGGAMARITLPLREEGRA